MNITHIDNYNILPNLIIRSFYNDGVLYVHEIYPQNGYVLRIPRNDVYLTDDEGNYVLDENGNYIVEFPYRSWGGASEFPSYDWVANPENYYAELYVEGMEVFNKPQDEVTI